MARIVNGVLRCANPFGVVEPPAWWLRDMQLFDDKLVVFPSQKRGTMLLARKATRSKGQSLHDVKGLSQNPDTVLMATHHLVRVCEILPGTLWDQRIFQKLAAHDIQRLGGAKVVADRLDEMDAKKQAAIRRKQQDDIAAISTDAYLAYKTRVGERLSLTPNPHGRGTVTPNRVSVRVAAPKPSSPGSRIVLATA